MSLQEIKSNIAGCENGIKIAEARLKGNEEKLKHKNLERDAWRVRQNTHNSKHEGERTKREQEIQKWNTRYQAIRDNLAKQRQDGSCAAAGNCGNSNCPSGWVNDGSVHGWQGNCDICLGILCAQTGCRVKCRKPDDVLDREAREGASTTVVKGQGGGVIQTPKPDPYVVPAFTETDPGEVQLDNTPLTIGCCNTVTTIMGSELKDSDIKQQNDCLGNLQNTYQQAEKDAVQKPVPVPVVEKTIDKDTTDTKSMIIIFLVICVLLLILIGVVFFVF